MTPKRPVNAIFGPDRAVGEANLAADWRFAARNAHVAQRRSNRIGVVVGKARDARRKRLDLAVGIEGGESFRRDRPGVARRHRISRSSGRFWPNPPGTAPGPCRSADA